MAKRPHGAAIAGYVALTIGVLWPAVVRFSSSAVTNPADGSVFRWIWWSMPRAIGEGRNPFTTDEIFHPVGADLAVTTSAPLISALSWPVQALFGQAAQVNVVQLAAMFIAGTGAYLLAHEVCRDRGAAFLAGVAYALLPHRFVDVTGGHLNLVHTGVLPLGLLAFLRLLDDPTRRRMLTFGLVTGASFLIEPQLTILLGFALLPLGVVYRTAVARSWRLLLGSGAIAAVVSAPLMIPMAGAMIGGESGEPAPTAASLVYASSPLSWVIPPLDRLWVGHLGSVEPLTPTVEGIAYPGLLILVLAGWRAAGTSEPGRRAWVAVAAMGFVLSLGPYPFVRDRLVKVPLPFFVVHAVPGLDTFRAPGRFALVGGLGLVVLAASGLALLIQRHPHHARLLVAATCAVTLVELLPRSLPETPAEVPAPYHAIADHPDPGAVLEIPIQWSTGEDAVGYAGGRHPDFLFLVNATVHGRPTVSGAASRYSSERFERLLENRLYRQVLSLQGEDGFDDPPTFKASDLAAAGIGFVAYDRSEPAPRALAYLRDLNLQVLADDGTVIVWRVSP